MCVGGSVRSIVSMSRDPVSDKLYYGDNLDVLRKHIASKSVDLRVWTRQSTPTAPTTSLCGDSSEEDAAQIEALAPCLVELHRVLKPTG